jgi:RiboL-PSP-HEPN
LIDSRFKPFEEQFAALREVVVESNRRSVREPADDLFFNNQNVFIKSYVVSACSILEVYIQEIAAAHFSKLCVRVQNANIPHNLMIWNAFGDTKSKEFEYKLFEVTVSENQLRETISGNFEKTVRAFKFVGIDLLSSEEFCRNKDFVASFVEKRNNIIHHNDAASDLTLTDVVTAIDVILEYVRTITDIVSSSPFSSEV